MWRVRRPRQAKGRDTLYSERRRAGVCADEAAALRVMRKPLDVRRRPARKESDDFLRADERVNASTESRTKRGRGRGTELPRRARQRDRLRNLVAEETLGVRLRAVDHVAEPRKVVSHERIAGRGNDLLRLDEELLDTIGERLR